MGAADRLQPSDLNDYMGQTACEQIKCQREVASNSPAAPSFRPGGTTFRDARTGCRLIHRYWAATFRDATVQKIAISGDRAAALLSNHQAVQLQRIATGEWLIVKLGAW